MLRQRARLAPLSLVVLFLALGAAGPPTAFAQTVLSVPAPPPPIVIPYQAYRPVLPYYYDPTISSGGPYYVYRYPNPYNAGSAYYYGYAQPGGYTVPRVYRPYVYAPGYPFGY